MDAVIAASKHHVVLMENESVRVLRTVVHPGQTVPMHTHQWPAATTFHSVAELVRRDGDGQVVMDTRLSETKIQPGQCLWTPPLGLHTLENVGDTVLDVVTVEVKHPHDS